LRGDRIRLTREQRGWSQRELSRRAGLSVNQVTRYEAEEIDPTATNLKSIAETLDVSVDYLLGLTINPQGNASDCDLNEDERDMVEVFRREGWTGVIRLGADRVGKST
jgi:transcriptional regulator with XRE-family HTH domain